MSINHFPRLTRPFSPARRRIGCLILSLVIIMSTCSAGCGRVFDRSAYIRAMLDAVYHMEYDTLAQIRSTTPESIANEHQEFIRQEVSVWLHFVGLDDTVTIPDDLYSRIYNSIERAASQVQYTVMDADKDSQVTIRVTPLNLYPDLFPASTEANSEFRTANNKARYSGMSDTDYLITYLEPLVTILEKVSRNASYLDPVDVTVLVYPDAAARYSITNEDADRLYTALMIYEIP